MTVTRGACRLKHFVVGRGATLSRMVACVHRHTHRRVFESVRKSLRTLRAAIRAVYLDRTEMP